LSKNAGSGSVINQSGAITLLYIPWVETNSKLGRILKLEERRSVVQQYFKNTSPFSRIKSVDGIAQIMCIIYAKTSANLELECSAHKLIITYRYIFPYRGGKFYC
jgi:hypothetical protein